MVTILLTSIGRPAMEESIQSVLAQTSDDYELVIVDNGRGPYSQDMYEKYSNHYKVDWHWTDEPEYIYLAACPISLIFNKAYRDGLFRGEYFCLHYDDDVYYPTFIEKMAGYLTAHPEVKAIRCTQKRSIYYPDGNWEWTPDLTADRIMYPTESYDCRVDGMQVMFRTEILDKMDGMYEGELMGEDTENCGHSDGVFYNKTRPFVPEMHFINEPLCEHRNTIYGVYTSLGTRS